MRSNRPESAPQAWRRYSARASGEAISRATLKIAFSSRITLAMVHLCRHMGRSLKISARADGKRSNGILEKLGFSVRAGTTCDFRLEPAFSVGPVIVGGCDGHAERLG